MHEFGSNGNFDEEISGDPIEEHDFPAVIEASPSFDVSGLRFSGHVDIIVALHVSPLRIFFFHLNR